MQRKLDVLLWEVVKHGKSIIEFTAGKTLEEYASNRMIRLAVEREFTILGEVLVRVRKHFPADYEQMEHAREMVDFRNYLIHLYDFMKDEEVWRFVNSSVPAIVAQAQAMIDELQP